MPKKFDILEKKIEHQYEKKGYSPTDAKRIGYATAGKIAHLKKK